MISYIGISSFSHPGKFFAKPFRRYEFFGISFADKFYFSGFESVKVLINVEFYNYTIMWYVITSFFDKMIFYLESQLIKFLFVYINFNLFSDQSVSFFLSNFICITDVPYSYAFARSWIAKISLNNLLMRKLLDIHRYRFYEKFSFDFKCHAAGSDK